MLVKLTGMNKRFLTGLLLAILGLSVLGATGCSELHPLVHKVDGFMNINTNTFPVEPVGGSVNILSTNVLPHAL